MELNVTESLEKSILKPIYDQENTLNSEAFKKADELGADTGKFYSKYDDKELDIEQPLPFHTEVESKVASKAAELSKDFFVEHLPKFLANLYEDAIYGIFKGIENGVDSTTSVFPGLKPFVDEVAEANLAPGPFNMSLRDLSKRVHQLDAERDKTFANQLTTYMFQAAPYLFLVRARFLQGGFGVQKANLLAWMFASGMGFKNEELLVSDIYSKAIGDTKFLKALRQFDEKVPGVSVEGMLEMGARAGDGGIFVKLFDKIAEVYKHLKIANMDRSQKQKYLREEKDIKELSEGIVKQQDKKILGVFPKKYPDQDDIATATKVVKNINNPSDEIIENIKTDKNIKEVIEKQKTGELGSTANKFMDPTWQQSRVFSFDGTNIKGYENAIAHYYGQGAAKKDKIIHIMIGAPATGKSAKGKVIADHFGSKVIDSDHLKEAMTGKKNLSTTSAVHEEGKYLTEQVLNKAKDAGDNIVYPIIGHSEEKVMSVINNFANDGYKVKVVYAKAPTNTARMKNLKRGLVTGRLIPDSYFSKDLDNQIQYVYDVVSPQAAGSATIKTGTITKSAIIQTEKKGIEVYK
jgi:hypothetical protein